MKWNRLILILVSALLLVSSVPTIAAQGESQKEQAKPDKEETKGKEKKQSGGFLGGLKAISGSGSEQQQLTATAGSKTIGEDAQGIVDAQPTAADRKAVASMESYSIPSVDLTKFQSDGQLKPAN